MKTLKQYETETINKCSFCGGNLGNMEHYKHEGGFSVEGFKCKRWLYKTCLNCGYEWSIKHLKECA